MNYMDTHPIQTDEVKTYLVHNALSINNIRTSVVVRTNNKMDAVRVVIERNRGMIRSLYDCLTDVFEQEDYDVIDFTQEFNALMMMDQDYYFGEVGEFRQM
jgi:hypothetical protein